MMILRFLSENGTPASQKKTSAAVDRMFGENIYQPRFLYKDPLTRFFSEFQRHNASKLKSIILHGPFKTAWSGIGLTMDLFIQTLVLKELSTDLQTLFLHRTAGCDDGDSGWEELQGDTDDEKMKRSKVLSERLCLCHPRRRSCNLGVIRRSLTQRNGKLP